jgi:hypothetical protein
MLENNLTLSATVDVSQGKTYAFRYRVLNVYGWSDYSPATFILAASEPEAPSKPKFVQATKNSISIQLEPS